MPPDRLPRFPSPPPCTLEDPDLFHSELDVYPVAALAACRQCAFSGRCLEYAIAHDVRGLWAGTTYAERRERREQAGIDAVPVTADIYLHCDAAATAVDAA